MKKISFHARFREDLYEQLRTEAFEARKNMNDLVNEALEAYLKREVSEMYEKLGFKDSHEFSEASEYLYEEGDITWGITRLKNGDWAAWTDVDEPEIFENRLAALRWVEFGLDAALVNDENLETDTGSLKNAINNVNLMVQQEVEYLEEMYRNYGVVEYEGKKYILTEQAEYNNSVIPGNDEEHGAGNLFGMQARAIDPFGNNCTVYWIFEEEEGWDMDQYDYDNVDRVEVIK